MNIISDLLGLILAALVWAFAVVVLGVDGLIRLAINAPDRRSDS